MRAVWLTMLFFGCGGKDKDGVDAGDGDADTDSDTDEPGGGPDERCLDIQTYDIDGMSCPQLGSAYEDLLGDADRCTIDANCQAIRAPCEHWNQVECWYVANDCIKASGTSEFPTLSEFDSESQGCATTQVCDCNGSTPAAKCEEGRCILEFPPYY